MNNLYMNIALEVAKNSCSTRSKVGAVLVKDQNIIGFGWNGTPPGFDNCCEDIDGNTVPWVIHAEQNVYAKAARAGISTVDSILYVTLSPCYDCAKLIAQAGTKTVIYKEEYRIPDAIKFLNDCRVHTLNFDELEAR